MHDDLLSSLRRLSDAELVAQLRDLAARERGAVVLLVAHLAEFDTRDVHLRAGHGSLFAYCRDVLALSEQEAYNRIAVARAVRRFPKILGLLEEGALNLTSARLLAPHLTAENHREVLDAARGKNKLQVEEIAARLWPRRRCSFLRSEAASAADSQCSRGSGFGAFHGSSAGAGPLGSPPGGPVPIGTPDGRTLSSVARPPERHPADVTVLSPDRYRVQVTIGGDTLEKLRLAKDLLRHAVPSGDEAAILDRALTALLTDLAQRKFAAAEKPRAAGGHHAGFPPHPRRGQACRVAARSRALRVRRHRRAALRRAGVRGVPPCASPRPRRSGHGREHPATMSRPQRLRGQDRLRAQQWQQRERACP